MPPDMRLWVQWAQRWAFAKEAGALSSYLHRPSLRTLDLLEIAEEELLMIRQEAEARQRKRLEAGKGSGSHGI